MKTNPMLNQAIAAQRFASLSRRHFLRGLGACLALPTFETLRPFGVLAADGKAAGQLAASPTGAPLRMAFVYFPNGAIPANWWPIGERQDFELKRPVHTVDS